MRRTRTLALAAVAAAVPLTALGVGPAAAQENPAQREYVGPFHGQTVRCTVVGSSSVDLEGPGPDEDGQQIAFTTGMIDDDPACQEAITWVAAYASYWRTGATEPDRAETSTYGTQTFGHVVVRGGLDDVVVDHVASFKCDGSEVGCELAFSTDPYPFSSK